MTCGVTRYLLRTLTGLASQTLAPNRVLILDVWSHGRDLGTGEDISRLVTEVELQTPVRILRVPGAANFGEAIRGGLALNADAQAKADRLLEARTGELPAVKLDDSNGWYWLLHDDSEPAPDALAELLKAAEFGRSIGIAGAKQRDWDDHDKLLSVGIQATRSARRFNPIDEDEIDQGQHDAIEDVLAVGLAGAIVRRDVWNKLEGPDPALGPFGDGLEFGRRARLAGYRVIVVPSAVVFHKQATYLGLRSYGYGPQHASGSDPTRSFGPRRRAQLYNWLLAAPNWQVPLIFVWLLLLSPARALSRLLAKDIPLAGAELAAGWAVLTRPDQWMAGRRRNRASSAQTNARLTALEVSPREIRSKKRESRRVAKESRRISEAPSELELAELAAMAKRRRTVLIGLTLLTSSLTVVAFGGLLLAGNLRGGALLDSTAGLSDLHELWTSGWIPVGLGAPGPADPFYLVAMLPLLAGITLGTAQSLLLYLAMPLAAVGMWLAAGTVTRAIPLRAWSAVVWAFAPSLLLGVFQGRVGPTLTHVLLPFFVLALMRAVGAARRDTVLSGLVGAQRVDPTEMERVSSPAAIAERSRYVEFADLADDGGDAGYVSRAAVATSALAEPEAGGSPGTDSTATGTPDTAETAETAETAATADAADTLDAVDAPDTPVTADAPDSAFGPAPVALRAPSLAAGAAAALLMAAIAAATPVLAPVLLVVSLVLLVSPARRTTWLLALPMLAVLGPFTVAAIRTGDWEAFAGGPGAVLAYEPAGAVFTLLGLPAAIESGTLPDWLTLGVLAPAAVTLLLGTVGLVRHSGRIGLARIGWLAGLAGLGIALAAPYVATGVDLAGTLVRGWPGAGTSLALLGLLVAALGGWDGAHGAIARPRFGWRQLAVVFTGMVAGAAALAGAAIWILAAHSGIPQLEVLSPAPDHTTPALSRQLAATPDRARTLALTPEIGGTLTAELWRSDGPQAHLTGSVISAGQITDPLGFTAAGPSAESTELARAAAQLSAGVLEQPAETLAEYGIGVVLVPPGGDELAREHLVAELDSTLGLARVTNNEFGTLWRVNTDERAGSAASIARLSLRSADGTWLADVPSGAVTAAGSLPAGGAGRLMVLTERADPNWRLTVAGRPAASVDYGWQQAFEIPNGGGEFKLEYAPEYHAWWLIAQGLLIGLTALVAIPARRRTGVE